MSCMTPLRLLIFSTTTPAYGSSTSTSTSSNGSSRAPGSGLGWGSPPGPPIVHSHPPPRTLPAAPRLGIELGQPTRPADRQLEPLAPHRLDQHPELQLAAARNLERIGFA